jgi:hypothetical protein
MGPNVTLINCRESVPTDAVDAVTWVTAFCEVRHIRLRVFRV